MVWRLEPVNVAPRVVCRLEECAKIEISHCASENKSIAINQPLFLWFLGHHLLVQGGWNKQREDTECSSGTDSAHHPGTAANVTENPGFVQKTLAEHTNPQ